MHTIRLSILLVLIGGTLGAAPVVRELEWTEACDGSSLEVTSEGERILGARASAIHFSVIAEWNVHYIDGIPVTAEYRETERGRISEGDKAGEPSGINRLKKIQTFKAGESGFEISDPALAKELAELIAKARGRN